MFRDRYIYITVSKNTQFQNKRKAEGYDLACVQDLQINDDLAHKS